MKYNHLLEQLEFHDADPFAEPLLVNSEGRILRWMLRPGQSIMKHRVPSSPFYVVILKGRGMFASNDEPEQEFGPHTLITFESNEAHTVRALDEDLVFISFLQAISIAQPDSVLTT